MLGLVQPPGDPNYNRKHAWVPQTPQHPMCSPGTQTHVTAGDHACEKSIVECWKLEPRTCPFPREYCKIPQHLLTEQPMQVLVSTTLSTNQAH